MISYLRELNIWSMMLRIVFAMLMGGIVGIEREKKRRAAGFRTYMLVAVGAALTVMLGQYLSIMLTTVWSRPGEEPAKTDVVRFAAQVINGVGFLGAGTIIVTGRQEVKGLTTAAGLWASACMGLAIGAGFYECMLIGCLLILLSLELLPVLEEAMNAISKNLNVHVEMEGMESVSGVIGLIKASGHRVLDVEIEKEQHGGISTVSAVFTLLIKPHCSHTEVLAEISAVGGITYVEEI